MPPLCRPVLGVQSMSSRSMNSRSLAPMAESILACAISRVALKWLDASSRSLPPLCGARRAARRASSWVQARRKNSPLTTTWVIWERLEMVSTEVLMAVETCWMSSSSSDCGSTERGEGLVSITAS